MIQFHMKTIKYASPQNQIYGGFLTCNPGPTKQAIAALVDIDGNQSKYLASHTYTVWYYISGIGMVIMPFIANVLNDDSTAVTRP